jgi:hypothetical protein
LVFSLFAFQQLCVFQLYIFTHRSGYLKTSETHIFWGEAFGVVAWLWIFHRARKDLPVVLGWRHPWEHDSHEDHHHENHNQDTADMHATVDK